MQHGKRQSIAMANKSDESSRRYDATAPTKERIKRRPLQPLDLNGAKGKTAHLEAQETNKAAVADAYDLNSTIGVRANKQVENLEEPLTRSDSSDVSKPDTTTSRTALDEEARKESIEESSTEDVRDDVDVFRPLIRSREESDDAFPFMLKRANPVYDSEDEDDEDYFESPTKRHRAGTGSSAVQLQDLIERSDSTASDCMPLFFCGDNTYSSSINNQTIVLPFAQHGSQSLFRS